jgi:hypothetical protein
MVLGLIHGHGIRSSIIANALLMQEIATTEGQVRIAEAARCVWRESLGIEPPDASIPTCVMDREGQIPDERSPWGSRKPAAAVVPGGPGARNVHVLVDRGVPDSLR